MSRTSYVLGCAALVAVGLWLRWPGVGTGFHGDDSIQLAMLRGQFPVERSIWDLFRFADVARDGRALMDFGYLPWWTGPDLRIAMFRPLASGLMALDHAVFGENAFAWHLHSALWFVALLGAVALLFHRLFAPGMALVALGIFALAPAHTAPFAWLANRSALVATTFGVLGLWLHVRGAGTPRVRLLQAAAFAVALLGGEYALATLTFVVAHELVATGKSVRDRVVATLPAMIPAALLFALRGAFGFGVRGSGYYLDAVNSPIEFASAALRRVPVLAADAVLGIQATWFTLGTPWRAVGGWERLEVWRSWHVLFGLVAMAALAVAVRFACRRAEPDTARHLRWLSLGVVLSLVPAAGALPQDRVLLPASFGIAPLFATLIALAMERFRRGRWFSIEVIGAAAVLTVHVAEAASRSHRQILDLVYMAAAQRRWAQEADIPTEGAGARRVLLLAGADFTTNALLPWLRLVHGQPLPRSYWRLSGSWHVHDLHRIADNVLDVAVLSDDVDETMAGSLYRSAERPLLVGDRVELDGLAVEVQRISRSNPWRVRYTFERSLDDPSFVFIHSTDQGLVRVQIPPVGMKKRLPMPQPPRL